jgi:YggT family protein
LAPGADSTAPANDAGRNTMNGLMVVLDPLIRIALLILTLYFWVVIASAILSWLVAFNVVNPRNQIVYNIGTVLYRLTEPVFRPIRRILPSFGGIDLSPIIVILAIYFLQMVLTNIRFSLLGLG